MRPPLLFTFTALSGLGLTVPVPATQPNAAGNIEMLMDLTTICEDLMGPASQLSVLNAPLALLGVGPWAAVLDGFSNIATTITSGTSALPPNGQFTASEELAVTDAFHSFSTAQTGLLGPLTTQAGAAVATVPVLGKGMAGLLGLISLRAEGLGTEITNLVRNPGANGVATDMGSLRDAFGAAIEAFS